MATESDVAALSALAEAVGSTEHENARDVDFLVVFKRTELNLGADQHSFHESSCDRCNADVVISKDSFSRSPGALLVCTGCIREAPDAEDWATRGRGDFATEWQKRVKSRRGDGKA